METKSWRKNLRKWLINKYAITLFVFAVLYLFVGDNSFIQYLKRAKKIREVEQEIQLNNEEIQKTQSIMTNLENKDSLERFAREEYRMHAPNEDVYIVEP
jgi:cell division protein FtsB